MTKSGFIALIGRPNAGKSSLLNRLIGTKVSIVSKIAQTTRYQVRGVLTSGNTQLVFVDTPGIQSVADRLASHLNEVAKKGIDNVEVIVYVIDVSKKIKEDERTIMKLLSSQKIPVVMVFNKIDLGSAFMDTYIASWKRLLAETGACDPVRYYLPVSAKEGTNIEPLKTALIELIPEQPLFYPDDTVTDFPFSFRAADIIREKLYERLKDELPYSCAIHVRQVQDKTKLCSIAADIYVNRESQRMIFIGKGGSFIKTIGTAARKELETVLRKKVFLDLKVVVFKDWQKHPRILKSLGYWWS